MSGKKVIFGVESVILMMMNLALDELSNRSCSGNFLRHSGTSFPRQKVYFQGADILDNCFAFLISELGD